MAGRVLIVAGSDSGGGAGIQADIKTVTMLGGYASTAVTALTAQDTKGVSGVIGVPAAFVRKQMEMVLADIGADAVKTGMLYSAQIIETVGDVMRKYPQIPLIVDPVMVSTSGDTLLAGRDALTVMKEQLIRKATLVTPNIPEAEVLIGRRIENEEDMIFAGQRILTMGARAVLIKGGHAEKDIVSDVLVTRQGDKDIFRARRIDSRNTHGTGCTLASAIACGIANGQPLRASIATAREYVRQAIKSADGLGRGKGPLKHNYAVHGMVIGY